MSFIYIINIIIIHIDELICLGNTDNEAERDLKLRQIVKMGLLGYWTDRRLDLKW